MLRKWICLKTMLKEECYSQPKPIGSYRLHLYSSFCIYENSKTLGLRGKEPQHCKPSGTKGCNQYRGKRWNKTGKCILFPGAGRKIYFGKLEKAIIIPLTLSWVCACSEPAWIVFQWEWQTCGWRSIEGTCFSDNCACKSSELWLKTERFLWGRVCGVNFLGKTPVYTQGIEDLMDHNLVVGFNVWWNTKHSSDFLSTNMVSFGKKVLQMHLRKKTHFMPHASCSSAPSYCWLRLMPLLHSPTSWVLPAKWEEIGKTVLYTAPAAAERDISRQPKCFRSQIATQWL